MVYCVVFVCGNGCKAFGSKELYMASGDYDPFQAYFYSKAPYVSVLPWQRSFPVVEKQRIVSLDC
jgi:hypothetical protein